jgi:hypothetical protein
MERDNTGDSASSHGEYAGLSPEERADRIRRQVVDTLDSMLGRTTTKRIHDPVTFHEMHAGPPMLRELQHRLNQRFDIRLPDQLLEERQTIGDVVAYIANILENRPPSGESGNGDTLKIYFSFNARANLELRSISVNEVEKALRAGVTTRVDDKTGHLVYTVDDQRGGIRVVAEKAGDSITVLTAMRPEEFLEHAE